MNIRQPLIMGYGNPLRGDDGVGWHVAEQVSARLGALAEVQSHHQLTPDMTEAWAQASVVLLVDASATGAPGHITRRVLKPSARPAASFSHHVSADLLVGLTATLWGRCPPVTLYTISGADFALGETLSPPVQAAAHVLVARLVRRVRYRR